MLSLKEKVEAYTINATNKLEKIILEEVDEYTRRLQKCESRISVYKSWLYDGMGYENTLEVMDLIQELETRKKEYLLMQSTLVKVINDFREED